MTTKRSFSNFLDFNEFPFSIENQFKITFPKIKKGRIANQKAVFSLTKFFIISNNIMEVPSQQNTFTTKLHSKIPVSELPNKYGIPVMKAISIGR